MATTSDDIFFLASQPFFLPEIDVIRFRNNLINLFGLNINQVAINTANDVTGNIYRQILLDREAYARYLKHLVSPNERLTVYERIAAEQDNAQTELKQYNLAQNTKRLNLEVLHEMLLMFAEYFRLQEMIQNEMLLKARDSLAKEADYERFRQANTQSQTTHVSDSRQSNNLNDLHKDYLNTIKHIDALMQVTELRLDEIKIQKISLSQQIKAYENKIEVIQSQLQQNHLALKDVDKQLVVAEQRCNHLIQAIESHKTFKKEEKQKLKRVRDKKEHANIQIQQIDAEMYDHEEKAELLSAEIELLRDKFNDTKLSDEEREQLTKEYYSLQTDQFIESMYGYVAGSDQEDLEIELKKLSKEEQVLEDHINVIKNEIKQFKIELNSTEEYIKLLNERKTHLAAEQTKLLSDEKHNQAKLTVLISEFKTLEREETLLYQNMDDLNTLKILHEKELFLTQTLMTINEKKPKLLEVLDKKQHLYDKSDKAVNSLSQAVEQSKSSLNKKEEQLKTLQPGSKAHTKLSKETTKLKAHNLKLTHKLDTQIMHREDAAKALTDIRNEVDKTHELQNNILHSLKQHQAEIHTLNNNIEQRKQQVDHINQQVAPAALGSNYKRFSPQYRQQGQQSQKNITQTPNPNTHVSSKPKKPRTK